MFAARTVNVWHEQACPLLLKLAIGLALNPYNILVTRSVLATTLSHVVFFQFRAMEISFDWNISKTHAPDPRCALPQDTRTG
jgi:hypothetical protein